MDEAPESAPEAPHVSQARLYAGLASSAVVLIAVGTVVFHILEDWDWIDSFYFSVVAVTTVGFGDFAPESDGGKLFAVAYIVVGISIVATYLDSRFKKHASRRVARRHGSPPSDD